MLIQAYKSSFIKAKGKPKTSGKSQALLPIKKVKTNFLFIF